MDRFLQNLRSPQLIFWIGFAAGCLFWWFQIRFRRALPDIRKRIIALIQAMRHGLTANTEARFKNDTLRYAQGMHLAAPLFSLDEILVKPRLLTPAFDFQQEDLTLDSDQAGPGIPYLPDWPALAASYHEPEISLPESLNGGSNLVLVGAPGAGKTTALAYLASIILRQNDEAGALRNFLPLLIHVGDLVLTPGLPGDPLDILVAAASVHASPLTLPRLKIVLLTELENGKLLLLLDGLDELPNDPVEQVVDYLTYLKSRYPSLRLVAAASLDYFDGLTNLGCVPVALAAWDDERKAQFIQGWGELWKRYIDHRPHEGQESYDDLLINNWLPDLLTNCNPLEVTLKVWAAYAEDASGPTNLDAIEVYLERITSRIPKARPVLEKLAFQMIVDRTPVVEARAADQWMPELTQQVLAEAEEAPTDQPEELPFGPGIELDQDGNPVINSEQETETSAEKKEPGKAPSRPALSLQRVLSDLASSGVLCSRKDQRVSFFHPVILGYLAGKAISSSGDFHCLEDQVNWTGARLALRYCLAWNDVGKLIIPMLNVKSDPLYRQILHAGGFLVDALPSAPWRHQVMHRLAIILQNELFSFALRARALCALVYSGDPGVATLFRQLLVSQQESNRKLAVFGAGMLRDAKSVPDLIALLDDQETTIQLAAVSALAAIRTKPAMEAILQLIKVGSEELRKAAAEVLAGFPEEGYPVLKEGSTDEDLLVRRAVVYGLVRVNQPWASELLQKMQIEDGQWVVRSAATQAIEEMQGQNKHAPRPLPPLNETPWLISYAGKQGMGISPGKSAQNILRQALINGDLEERAAVLNYLAINPDPGVIPQLYEIIYGSKGSLKEAAYNALWHLAATGTELPDPTQFGLG
jgi:HEAT repeat protein